MVEMRGEYYKFGSIEVHYCEMARLLDIWLAERIQKDIEILRLNDQIEEMKVLIDSLKKKAV